MGQIESESGLLSIDGRRSGPISFRQAVQAVNDVFCRLSKLDSRQNIVFQGFVTLATYFLKCLLITDHNELILTFLTLLFDFRKILLMTFCDPRPFKEVKNVVVEQFDQRKQKYAISQVFN